MAPKNEPRQRRPLWKRLLFATMALTMIVVTLEIVAAVTGRLLYGERFSRTQLEKRRRALIATRGVSTFAGGSRQDQSEVLHPFVGYVPQPPPGDDGTGLGFLSAHPTIQKREPGKVIVAVTGGSVAHQFGAYLHNNLQSRFDSIPLLHGKRVVLLNLAMPGFKQPQQLMSLAYVQALGGQVDFVINLDGFNEVALHPAENAPAGVFAAYPRRWHRRVEGIIHGSELRLMLNRVNLEQRRGAMAQTFSVAPWRYSYVANLLYEVFDRNIVQRISDNDREMMGNSEDQDGQFAVTGPRVTYENDQAMFAQLADIWTQCSLQMDRLCRGNQVRYYHFLQPNQYVLQTKTLSAQERSEAWSQSHMYRPGVEQGYPLLKQAGGNLAAQGVRFVDLTNAFTDHAETIYTDDCCHVNEQGNKIMADRIVEAIRRDLQSDSLPDAGAKGGRTAP